MRVVVVGAGIVGVATAYYLNQAGCEVTVLERNPGVAQEASFGNAGIVAPGGMAPWAAPGMPGKLFSTLFKPAGPVLLRPTLDPALWRWLARWFAQCDPLRYLANRSHMYRLAAYSLAQMQELRERLGLQYEQSSGCLQVFRSPGDLALAAPAIAMLRQAQVVHQVMTPAQCRLQETGLSDLDFAGGLFLPGDESGNCPLFARELKDISIAAGVAYRFGCEARTIERQPYGIRVTANQLTLDTDAVVLAAGASAAPLLKQLALRLPLYPVRGYGATVSVREPTYAPNHAVVDLAYDVAITRMGNRIRIAGTAELGRPTGPLSHRAQATLIKVARDWFPGGADYGRATYWTGLSPTLPEGPPVIGSTRHAGVFVNLGHGAHGWAMACGSGRVVADLVTERRPEIDLDGLTIARYA